MSDTKVGVINEQGYFGEGFGFREATEEEKEKLERGGDDQDPSRYFMTNK